MFNPIVVRDLVLPSLTAIGLSGTTEFHSSGLSARSVSVSVVELYPLGVEFLLHLEERLMLFIFSFLEDARLSSPKNPGNILERIGRAACTQVKIMPTLVSTREIIQIMAP